jgi:hypothetical protein
LIRLSLSSLSSRIVIRLLMSVISFFISLEVLFITLSFISFFLRLINSLF